MKLGDMAGLIDQNGTDNGLCIYLDMRYPVSGDAVMPGCDALWHFEVLHDGKVKLLCTSTWTLMPVPSE